MDFTWVMNYGFQTIAASIMTYLLAQGRIQKNRYKATQSGLKALLKDRLISAIHKCKEQGFVYVYELENIDSMFTEYSKLGGNGAIVHMMNEISKLPTKTSYQ